jgi:predicted Zn-dependent protease
MLFDLRSRGRRRTVQGVYLGLALLMGGGLVLFGVGAGNGFGGILNAFTGGGSSGSQKQAVSDAEKQALRETSANPNDPKGWADLVQARWTSAGQGNNYNTSTQSFTAPGKKQLTSTVQAWQHYLQVTKHPDPNIAILAARAYGGLGDYRSQASAWEAETLANPSEAKGFECLAAAAYAGKQNRKGDLATARALALLPKPQRLQTKQQIQAAKKNPQAAQQC